MFVPFKLLVVHLVLVYGQTDCRAQLLEAVFAFEVPCLLVHYQDALIYEFTLAIPGWRMIGAAKGQRFDRHI